jgi:hypothetical protein
MIRVLFYVPLYASSALNALTEFVPAQNAGILRSAQNDGVKLV